MADMTYLAPLFFWTGAIYWGVVAICAGAIVIFALYILLVPILMIVRIRRASGRWPERWMSAWKGFLDPVDSVTITGIDGDQVTVYWPGRKPRSRS